MQTRASLSASAERSPLDAVPVASLYVRAEPNAGSGVMLWIAPPARGRIGALLEKRLGFARSRGFELDEVGASFWNAIDGVRSLLEIQACLRRRFALDEAISRRAVIEFTSMLMRRGLISLRVQEKERAG